MDDQADNGSHPRKGMVLSWRNDTERHDVLERVFDYRGDVTLHTSDGRMLEGYVFSRANAGTASYLQMILKNGGERVRVPSEMIEQVVFSGHDTASGKSWEAWVEKNEQMKKPGNSRTIGPEDNGNRSRVFFGHERNLAGLIAGSSCRTVPQANCLIIPQLRCPRVRLSIP